MAEPLLAETSTEGFFLPSCAEFYLGWLDLTFLTALVDLFLLLFLLVKDKFGLFLILDLISDLSCFWDCWKADDLHSIARNTHLKWISSIVLELLDSGVGVA